MFSNPPLLAAGLFIPQENDVEGAFRRATFKGMSDFLVVPESDTFIM